MAEYAIHVPFIQYDEFVVEADSPDEAIEKVRDSRPLIEPTNINVYERAEYDWNAPITFLRQTGLRRRRN